MNMLLPIFIKCTVGVQCNKPYCDITLVATRVTKEKQLGHLTPRCAHVAMLKPGDSFGIILSIQIDSICLLIISLVSSW